MVASIDSAAFFSLDETHWPLITAEHDRLAARKGSSR